MVRINKTINNNVCSILDETGNEQIVMGKGICFGKKPGDLIDENLINKRFFLKDSDYAHVETILKEIPIEYLNLANDALTHAKFVLNEEFSDRTIISLTDHIYTTVLRYKEGSNIVNPILWELKRYYQREFEMSLEIVKMINQKFEVNLPEDEAGFITVHLIDGMKTNCNPENVTSITKLIQEISNIVRYFFNVELDSTSVNYYRFITHIKFFSERVILKNSSIETNDDSLYEIIKKRYVNSYHCVKKIEKHLLDNYNFIISNEEKLYLMIHIQRLVYASKN